MDRAGKRAEGWAKLVRFTVTNPRATKVMYRFLQLLVVAYAIVAVVALFQGHWGRGASYGLLVVLGGIPLVRSWSAAMAGDEVPFRWSDTYRVRRS